MLHRLLNNSFKFQNCFKKICEFLKVTIFINTLLKKMVKNMLPIRCGRKSLVHCLKDNPELFKCCITILNLQKRKVQKCLSYGQKSFIYISPPSSISPLSYAPMSNL